MRLLKPDTRLEDVTPTAARGTQGSAFLTYRRRPHFRRRPIPGLAFRRRARQRRLRRPQRQQHQRAASAASASRPRERGAPASSNHLQPYRHLRQAPSRLLGIPLLLLQPAAREPASPRRPAALTTNACCRRWLLFTNTTPTPRQLSLASGRLAELKQARPPRPSPHPPHPPHESWALFARPFSGRKVPSEVIPDYSRLHAVSDLPPRPRACRNLGASHGAPRVALGSLTCSTPC